MYTFQVGNILSFVFCKYVSGDHNLRMHQISCMSCHWYSGSSTTLYNPIQWGPRVRKYCMKVLSYKQHLCLEVCRGKHWLGSHLLHLPIEQRLWIYRKMSPCETLLVPGKHIVCIQCKLARPAITKATTSWFRGYFLRQLMATDFGLSAMCL